jgi:hypothetical protein
MKKQNPSTPKRHHYVPACYLKAWADSAEQIAVFRRGMNRPFVTGIINVACESGLYGQGGIASAREKMFGSLEEDWPRLRDKLITSGDLRGEDRSPLSLFAAFQLARTRQHIAQSEFSASVAAFSSERPVSRDVVRRFLVEKHLGFRPSDAEVGAAWTIVTYVLDSGDPPSRDEVLGMALEAAVKELAPRLSNMKWTVETCRKRILFTSDRPVMYWRPESYRDAFEGIGLENADEVRFPLDPCSLLVCRRRGDESTPTKVEPKRFIEVNKDIAAQCFEFVVAGPSRVDRLRDLQMADRLPSVRFNMAPGVRRTPDGRDEPMGDVLHMWVPVRETRRS